MVVFLPTFLGLIVGGDFLDTLKKNLIQRAFDLVLCLFMRESCFFIINPYKLLIKKVHFENRDFTFFESFPVN